MCTPRNNQPARRSPPAVPRRAHANGTTGGEGCTTAPDARALAHGGGGLARPDRSGPNRKPPPDGCGGATAQTRPAGQRLTTTGGGAHGDTSAARPAPAARDHHGEPGEGQLHRRRGVRGRPGWALPPAVRCQVPQSSRPQHEAGSEARSRHMSQLCAARHRGVAEAGARAEVPCREAQGQQRPAMGQPRRVIRAQAQARGGELAS